MSHSAISIPLRTVVTSPAIDPGRRRCNRRRVRADSGLGARERSQRRALTRERLHPPTGLLLVAEDEHRLREEAVGGDQVADARTTEAELLLHERLGEGVLHAPAAELRGQHERGEAQRGGFVPDVPGHVRVRRVDSERHGADLALGELAAKTLDLPLLYAQLDQIRRHGARFSQVQSIWSSRDDARGWVRA